MDGTIENTNNNFNQPAGANAGAVANPEGLMTVQPAVESLPDIENPVSEAESTSMVEEKPKDEPLIFDNSVIKPISSPEAELKVDSPEVKKVDSRILDSLVEKYKNTFIKGITDKNDINPEGIPFLIFKGDETGNPNFAEKMPAKLVVTEKGFIYIPPGVYKQVEHFGGLKSQLVLHGYDANPGAYVKLDRDYERQVMFIDFRDESQSHDFFKQAFLKYEELHKNDVEPKEPTTQEIIDSL